VKCNARAGLAPARAAKAELVRDLPHCPDAAANQDFKQEFEAGRLKSQSLDAASTDYEKA